MPFSLFVLNLIFYLVEIFISLFIFVENDLLFKLLQLSIHSGSEFLCNRILKNDINSMTIISIIVQRKSTTLFDLIFFESTNYFLNILWRMFEEGNIKWFLKFFLVMYHFFLFILVFLFAILCFLLSVHEISLWIGVHNKREPNLSLSLSPLHLGSGNESGSF